MWFSLTFVEEAVVIVVFTRGTDEDDGVKVDDDEEPEVTGGFDAWSNSFANLTASFWELVIMNLIWRRRWMNVKNCWQRTQRDDWRRRRV